MAISEKQSQSRLISLRWKGPRSLISVRGHRADDEQAQLAPGLGHVDRHALALEEGRVSFVRGRMWLSGSSVCRRGSCSRSSASRPCPHHHAARLPAP
eukprot:6575463-Prymnesium_polylepis.2